jgi:hypothetical protein
MPRRTLAAARRVLEHELLPRVSDYWAAEAGQVLEAAEAKARQVADGYAAARDAEIRLGRDEALRELTAVRDELEDLATQGATGRLRAADYSVTLHDLRERQVRAEDQLAQAAEKVALVEQIEADPIAWFDEFACRQPHVMPEVPW